MIVKFDCKCGAETMAYFDDEEKFWYDTSYCVECGRVYRVLKPSPIEIEIDNEEELEVEE